MNTNTEHLTNLKELLKQAQENLKQCNYAFKGLRTFRGNHAGIGFCIDQLQQAATALHKHATELDEIAEDLNTTYRDFSEQMELNDLDITAHP